MTLPLRSLRVRLSVLYAFFTIGSICSFGLFSYWHLSSALATTRLDSMVKREERLTAYINNWPSKDTSLSLTDKLRELSIALEHSDSIQVYDLNGSLLYSSASSSTYTVPWPHEACIERCYAVVMRNGHSVRTLSHVVFLDGRQVRLSISGETNEHLDVLKLVRNSYLIFCPFLLVASLAGGLVISHRALQPVSSITTKARMIGIQDLHQRLPVPETGDEIQALAETWNDLLGRLDTAVSRLTQFTSDISHDLRTTLSVMLNTAEFALRRRRREEEYREALQTIVEECQTTSRLLDDLLAAARADIVQQKIEWNPVELSDVALEVCEHLRIRAEDKRLSLETRICRDAWTTGDLFMIRRLVTILVDNAIKYTPTGGTITVSVRTAGDRLQLHVADTGIGIPADCLARIFDRFYRVDSSRSREDGSAGLGLAIAKWIVDAHLSVITVAATPGAGSIFTVSMPQRSFEFEAHESNRNVVTKPMAV